MKKQVYAVFSYDTDQQQSFCDIVQAATPSQAEQKVSEARDYAIVTHCYTSSQLRGLRSRMRYEGKEAKN